MLSPTNLHGTRPYVIPQVHTEDIGDAYVSEPVNPEQKTRSIPNLSAHIDIKGLLEAKLKNPKLSLTPEQSIALLSECINAGKVQAANAKGKELIVLIGNTGAGKSTLANYLIGCKMKRTTHKAVGQTGIGKVVVVVPKSEGGTIDQVMAIGHNTKQSMTFMPQIESDNQFTYCDCPGFLDSRGIEINIANAVNIMRAFKHAKNVKVMILINYHSLLADKANGLNAMIEICVDLFGSRENLTRYKEAILLGVTQVPIGSEDDEPQTLEELQNFICKPPLEDPFSQATLDCLAERVFVYDPLDYPQLAFSGSLIRQQIIDRIRNLEAIQEPSNIFKTVLTNEDKQGLVKICDQIKEMIDGILIKSNISSQDFSLAAAYLESLRNLEIIEHPYVIKLMGNTRNIVVQYFKRMKQDFDRSCAETKQLLSTQSEEILGKLRDGIRYFDEEIAKDVDLPELEHRFELYKKRIEAREAVSKFRELEKRVYAFCQSNDFVSADQDIKDLENKINIFNLDYGSTGVSAEVIIPDLKKFYVSSKQAYDNWAKSRDQEQTKIKELEKAQKKLEVQNKKRDMSHQKEMQAMKEETLLMQENLKKEIAEAKAAREKSERELKEKNEKLEEERKKREEIRKKAQEQLQQEDRPLQFPIFNPLWEQQMQQQQIIRLQQLENLRMQGLAMLTPQGWMILRAGIWVPA